MTPGVQPDGRTTVNARVRVKICGITRPADATAAVGAGADALGFMFYEGSPRHITPARAAAIAQALPPFVARVGVFVNPGETLVREAIQVAGLTVLQFHGEESPEFCARFAPWPVIKAFRIRDAASLDALPAHAGASAWLLDAYVAGRRGGTGTGFCWELAVRAKAHGVPVILAGGLTPENAGRAVLEVAPYGLDVSSGVEAAPGIKDPERMGAFMAAVNRAAGRRDRPELSS